MNSRKLIVISIFAIAVGFSFGGISGASEQKELEILMSIPRASNPFHGRCAQKVVEEAAKIGGIKITVADGMDDVQKQLAQVEAAIAKGIDGIIMAPIEEEGAIPTVEAAWEAGVPLVTYDRTVKSDKIFAHVGHQNVTGGKEVGHWLANQIGKKGEIILLQGWAGCGATRARSGGFREALSQYPDIRLFQFDAFNRRDLAKEVMENALTAFSGVEGVFSINEDMMLGAIPVMEERGVRPKTVSYDTHIENLKLIKEGRMDAVYEQFPDKQVHTALHILVDYLREGKKPAKKELYLTGELITKDNLQDSEKWDEVKDKI